MYDQVGEDGGTHEGPPSPGAGGSPFGGGGGGQSFHFGGGPFGGGGGGYPGGFSFGGQGGGGFPFGGAGGGFPFGGGGMPHAQRQQPRPAPPDLFADHGVGASGILRLTRHSFTQTVGREARGLRLALLLFYRPGSINDADVATLTKLSAVLRGAALVTVINCDAEKAVCGAYDLPPLPVLRLLHPGGSTDLSAGRRNGAELRDAVAKALQEGSRVRVVSGAGLASRTSLDKVLQRFCGSDAGGGSSGIPTCVLLFSNRTDPPLFFHALSMVGTTVNASSSLGRSSGSRGARGNTPLSPVTYIFVSTPTTTPKEGLDRGGLTGSAAAALLPGARQGAEATPDAVFAAMPALLAVHGGSFSAVRDGPTWKSDAEVIAAAADAWPSQPLVGRYIFASGGVDSSQSTLSFEGVLRRLRQHAAAVSSGIAVARSEGRAKSTPRVLRDEHEDAQFAGGGGGESRDADRQPQRGRTSYIGPRRLTLCALLSCVGLNRDALTGDTRWPAISNALRDFGVDLAGAHSATACEAEAVTASLPTSGTPACMIFSLGSESNSQEAIKAAAAHLVSHDVVSGGSVPRIDILVHGHRGATTEGGLMAALGNMFGVSRGLEATVLDIVLNLAAAKVARKSTREGESSECGSNVAPPCLLLLRRSRHGGTKGAVVPSLDAANAPALERDVEAAFEGLLSGDLALSSAAFASEELSALLSRLLQAKRTEQDL